MAAPTPLAPAPLPTAPPTPPETVPPTPLVPPGPSRPRRRGLLGALLALTGLAGTGGALAPLLRTVRETTAEGPGTADSGATGSGAAETYRGRHLAYGPDWATIDGRALHLMPRADGGFVSSVDHYTSYPDTRAAARAAVDELGGARLSTPAYGA
ncbi:tyrosinase family oxidase copper chaperone [Streptomyces sp. NPDC004959]|uniref:tyrosinase family oxidase copper chaperone n=1 Tax=unclassified Streptomyces TaxID=2593676 RepID=UPI000997D2E9|nr:tyrosinase family oxidase copper chaperone [Streptomyces sp. NRRL F-5630]